MTYRNLVIACFLFLSLEQANAATWNIDGVFHTKFYDANLENYFYSPNPQCSSLPSGCAPSTVSSVTESLTGTVDVVDGVLTAYNLTVDTSNYTIPGPEALITNFNSATTPGGHIWNLSQDGQSWSFFFLFEYNELQFSVGGGALGNGLLDNWTDYDIYYSWENKFTDLTGTAVDPPTVTPLPPALPLFAAGLLALLTLRRTQWLVGN